MVVLPVQQIQSLLQVQAILWLVQVNAGNLDPVTVEMNGAFVTAGTFTGNYTFGNVSITQNGLTGTLQISIPVLLPPMPGSITTVSANPYAAAFYLLLQRLTLQEQMQIDAQNLISSQIGTRIPTGCTPWTSYPMQPQEYSLYNMAMCAPVIWEEKSKCLFVNSLLLMGCLIFQLPAACSSRRLKSKEKQVERCLKTRLFLMI